MARIIIGLIGTAIGVLITVYSENMLKAFGRVPSAEKYLGFEGGSRLFYKLLGVLIAAVAILYMTGLLQNMILGFFGPLFRVSSQQ